MAKTQAERAKAYRDGKRAERDDTAPNSVTVRDVTAERDGSFYESCIEANHYATRTHPDQLNTGPWLSTSAHAKRRAWLAVASPLIPLALLLLAAERGAAQSLVWVVAPSAIIDTEFTKVER